MLHALRPLTLLLALPLAIAHATQGPGALDVRCIGRVLQADGSAAPEGLKIRFQAAGLPGMPRKAGEGRTVAELGRSGRFVHRLPAGNSYAVWAEQPLEDGRVRFSQLLPEFWPGGPAALRLEAEPRTALTVRIEGLEAWKAHGPMRMTAAGRYPSAPDVELARAADGTWVLPPHPGTALTLTLWTANGRRLERWSADPRRDADKPIVQTLPAPLSVPLTLLDKGTKKPIAGATVLYRSRGGRYHVPSGFGSSSHWNNTGEAGVTDENGELELLLPWKWSPNNIPWRNLFFVADGYVTGSGRLRPDGNAQYVLKEREDAPPAIEMHLQPSPVIVGRVLGGDGKPIAGLPLMYEHRAIFYMTDNGMSWQTLPPRVIHTDAEGRFRASGMVPRTARSLHALPPPALRRQVTAHLADLLAEYPSSPHFPLWQGDLSAKKSGEVQLGDIACNKLRAFRIQVQGTGGRPARDAKLLYESQGSSRFELRGDRRGRIAMLLREQAASFIVWSEESGYRHVELTDEQVTSQEDALLVELDAWNVVKGRVVDADEAGIAGAKIISMSSSQMGNVPTLISVLSEMRRKAATDADGRFELRFPGHTALSFGLKAYYKNAKGKTVYAPEQFTVKAENMDDVIFRMPPQ